MPELGGARREPIAVFVVGTVVGAVVIGLAWLALSVLHTGNAGDPTVPAVGSSDSPTPGTTRTASAAQVTESRVQSCAAVFVAQGAALQAADAALGQWEVHVGAMNKLVTGVITLHEANQFWNSTRVGAWANLRQFQQAKQRYDHRADHCPERWTKATPVNQDIQRCRAAVSARNTTLRLATDALHTWKGHVKEMDMLRAGKMDPHQAEVMWIQSWHQGNHQVRTYTAAEKKARRLRC